MSGRSQSPDELGRELDARVGQRGRTLNREQRRQLIESAIGTISDSGHAWDVDPAAWVRDQRRGDARRVG